MELALKNTFVFSVSCLSGLLFFFSMAVVVQSHNHPTEVGLFVAAVSPFAHIPRISRIISLELVDLSLAS